MAWELVVIGHDGLNAQGAPDFLAALAPYAVAVTRSLGDHGTAHLRCDDPSNALNRAIILRLADAHGVDVYISRSPPYKRKLLLADMEATIILDEMLDLLAEARGIGAAVKDITARTMAGGLDFEHSLVSRTKLFAGTTRGQLQGLCQQIRLAPGAKALVQSMRASGAKTILVTGGYDIFAQFVADICGFDAVVANRPVMQNGLMTGALHHPICTEQTKRRVLMAQCAVLGIGPEMACCIGDGANDMLMLQACGLPASYKGKPIVREIVDLSIMQSDLTALLYAQGFSESEIVGR